MAQHLFVIFLPLLFPQCRSCLLPLSCCRRVRQVRAPEHGGARASAVCRFRHSLRSPPLDSASHDLRGGAGPCRRLVGVRDDQFALFCGAHHPPRDYMDCRPGAELGLLLAMVRHGSRRQSQLDSASEPLERKCVVDVQCRLDRHSTERWCTAPLTIRTPSARRLWRQARRALRSFSASLERSSSCCQGRSLATRTLEMARSASETLLSSATARTSRFSSIHHSWDHTTVFLCCASSRGRNSKCRGGSCSSAVVFLVFSNRQRSNCSCQG